MLWMICYNMFNLPLLNLSVLLDFYSRVRLICLKRKDWLCLVLLHDSPPWVEELQAATRLGRVRAERYFVISSSIINKIL